jgi:uncharacterized membrane protein YphA (DoxX/SURF4 family)
MGQVKLSDSFPPPLEAEWEAYFNRFVQHYDLSEKQKEQADDILAKDKAQFMDWLVKGKREVTWPSAFIGPVKSEKTMPERLAEYHAKQAEVLKIKNEDLWNARNNPVYETAANAKLRDAQTDVNRMRGEMRADITKWNSQLREDLYQKLRESLTDEQKGLSPLSPSMKREWNHWGRIEWIDFSVKWGLVVIGIALLAGFLTRPACLLGAGLLLMFYLAMPPLPWVPDNPKAEGHYLVINKNIIEMLALLALATTDSGRWLGLDGLLQFLNPWRKKPAPKPSPTAGSQQQQQQQDAAIQAKN